MSLHPSFTNIDVKKKLHTKECSPHYSNSREVGNTFQQIKKKNCMVFGWCPSQERMAEDAIFRARVLLSNNNAGCRVLLPHVH